MAKKLVTVMLAVFMLIVSFGCGHKTAVPGPDDYRHANTQTASPTLGNKGNQTALKDAKYRGYGEDVAILSFEGAIRAKLLLSRIDREDLAEFAEDDGSVVFKGFTFREVIEAVGAGDVKKLAFSNDAKDKVTLELGSIDLDKSVFAILKGDDVIGLRSDTKVIAAIRFLDGTAEYVSVCSAVWTE